MYHRDWKGYVLFSNKIKSTKQFLKSNCDIGFLLEGKGKKIG